MVLLSFPKRFRLAEAGACMMELSFGFQCNKQDTQIFYSPWELRRMIPLFGTRGITLVVGTKPGRPWSWIKGRSAVAALWCGIPVWSLHTAACLSLRWWPDVSAAQRVLWSFSFFLFIIRTALDLPGASSYDTSFAQMTQPLRWIRIHVKWIWACIMWGGRVLFVYCCHDRALLFSSVPAYLLAKHVLTHEMDG